MQRQRGIKPILDGRDTIGQAQSGAFALLRAQGVGLVVKLQAELLSYKQV